MPVMAVLGAQWGDEGKGKIVDVLSAEADVVGRFQGGANAGHTIMIGDCETILHQLPSGIMRDQTQCILGNGMVIDPIGLVQEIQTLEKRGIGIRDRIHIALQAHIVTPLHKLRDAVAEKARGTQAIGTTQRGIGPCYADKVNRTGLRGWDLLDASALNLKIQQQLEAIGGLNITDTQRSDCQRQTDAFLTAASQIAPYIEDTVGLIHTYLAEGRRILVEGAQGSLLDIDFGTYPYVTSSNTTAGNIATGLGIGPRQIDQIIGVYKAYNTRVGSGPFPTEQDNPVGETLRRTGNEFGATTGRPRRCGWFDAELARYTQRINGFTGLAITKLDVLDTFTEVNICTAYRNGRFPCLPLEQAEPEYLTLPGWNVSTRQAASSADLPPQARRYLDTLAELIGVPITYVSIGKARHQIFQLE